MMSVHSMTRLYGGPPRSGPVPLPFVGTVERALRMLRQRARPDAACNQSFVSLPLQRDFQGLFDNPHVWVNYDPTNDGALCGWTDPRRYPLDVVVTRFSLRMGMWMTAATIIHELAHLNGAPGGKSHAAELRVMECHLRSAHGPYDPEAEG